MNAVSVLCFCAFLNAVSSVKVQHQQTAVKRSFEVCERNFFKIGCFHDGGSYDIRDSSKRPLPQQLLNDRDKTSKVHEVGFDTDWNNWEQSLHSLACRCAKKAKGKGYHVFGLQFYGECWSGEGAEQLFARDGVSTNCVGSGYKSCNSQSDTECVGGAHTNYIYMLKNASDARGTSVINPVGPVENITCGKPLDITFMIDGSTSIGSRSFDKEKRFTTNIINQLAVSPEGTHVAFMHYSTTPWLDFPLNRYTTRQGVKQAINSIAYPTGWTVTDKALRFARRVIFSSESGMRPSVPKVLIVVYDGVSNQVQDSIGLREAAEQVKEIGVRIIPVLVMSDESRRDPVAVYQEAQTIASDHSSIFMFNDYSRLNKAVMDIVSAACP